MNLKPNPDIHELMELLRASDPPRFIEPDAQIYCNRDLQMRGIEWIGFDMDYTLALYHQEAIDRLSHEKTLERLVSHRGYPAEVLEIEPRPNFAIRGLVLDKAKGTIFKMDSHRYVGKVFRGFDEVPLEEIEEYQRRSIRISEDFHLVDTLFALPEAFLFAALIDFFKGRGGLPGTPRELFDDIRFSIDLAHRDDSIKNAILADLPQFIQRDSMLAPTLHRLRSAGKKLFVMTNSYHRYTRAVMTYLLDGVLAEYPTWQSYFDIVITGAKKPDFFSKRTPFYLIGEDGELAGEEHDRLERGRVYQHGNLVELEKMMGTSGPTVMYVGDHIYGDILRSRRASAWRTCMIVQEMTEELRKAEVVRREITERKELGHELNRLKNEILFIKSLERRFHNFVEELPEGDEAEDPDTERLDVERMRKDLRFRIDRLKRRRRRVIREVGRLGREIEQNFNQYWGLVFKEGQELSIFGKQVNDYACLYTSRVSNLALYSPLHHYRSPVDLLPHEL